MFRYNYVSFLFVIVTYFYNLEITLSISSMQLRFLMTLELHYILVRSRVTYRNNVLITFCFFRHCEVLFIMSQLRYLFVRCTYVF